MAKKPSKKPVSQPAIANTTKPASVSSPATNGPGAGSFSIKYLCMLLAIVSGVIYINTLWNGYVLDDVMVLRDNTMVTQGTKAIGELLSTPHMRGYLIIPNDMYRPLSLVMFAIEYQFFGPNPMVGHFFNIVVFTGCVIYFFLFLDKFFDRKKTAIAFIAALVFAVHPIHTEVVANIKSRDELMCFFFAFLSMNIFADYMKSGKMLQLIIGIIVFYLSLISKETVITFMAIVPVLFFFYINDDRLRAIYISAGCFVSIVVFMLVRSHILNVYNANQPVPVEFIDNALSAAPNALSKFATEVVVMGKYLKLMFLPYPLLCNYSYNAIPFADLTSIWYWLSLAAYGVMIYFGVIRWIKNKKDPWAFGILIYLATLSLFSNFPFLMGAILAERFAFFASAGVCLIVALAIEQFVIKAQSFDVSVIRDKKVLVVLVPLVVICSTLTIARNFDWKDEYTLYKTDVEHSPNDARLYHYIGTAIAETVYPKETDTTKQKELDKESIVYLRKSLEIYPDYSEAHIELGRIFDRAKMFDSALVHDIRGVELSPNNATAFNNLGSVYLAKANYQQAANLFNKSIALKPDFKYAYYNAARAYKQIQKYDSAVMYFRGMINLDPSFPDAYQELATTFYQMQRYDSCEFYIKRVLEMKPNDPSVANVMGAIYLNNKQYGQAIEWFKKAIKADPNFVTGYSNLGKAYYLSQQYALAIETITKEVSISPGSVNDIPYIALSYQKMGNMAMAKQYEAISQKYYANFKLE